MTEIVDDAPTAADDAGGGRSRRRIAPLIVLAVAVVVGGLFVVLAGADNSRMETAESNLLGRPAPDAFAATLDGRSFDLSQRKGSWVVLNFFTSTCVPCQREHPELIDFVDQQRSLGADGAEFYTVVFDDRRAAVEEYFADNGGDWTVVLDDDGAIAVAFGIAQVPETWIVDPAGFVRARYISQVTAEGLGAQLQTLREGG